MDRTTEMQHEHKGSEHLACHNGRRKVSKRDRLLILLLALILSLVFLRPFVSFQSMMRGYSYTELGENEKAIKHLKRSVYLYDKNDMSWSLLGYNLKRVGKIEESIEAYEKTLSLNKKDYQAATEYALILYHRQEYDRAIRILRASIDRKQELVGSWLLLARCYEKSGKIDEAVEVYREIYLKIDPGNHVALEKLKSYNAL